MTSEELSEAAQAVIDRLFEITPAPAFAAYDAAMMRTDSSCPYQTVTTAETTGEVHYWDGLCETAAGVSYKGPMTTWAWSDNAIDPDDIDIVREIARSSPGFDGFRMTGRAISGQTDIYNGDSSFDYNCSCSMYEGDGIDDAGNLLYFGFLQGRVSWTGAEIADTWIEDGVSPGYFVHVLDDVDGGRLVTSAGNVYGHHDRYDAAIFQIEVSSTPSSGVLCEDSVGALSIDVRDVQTAHWYDLKFDVIGDALGCRGVVDDPHGPVEVDLSSLLSWERRP